MALYLRIDRLGQGVLSQSGLEMLTDGKVPNRNDDRVLGVIVTILEFGKDYRHFAERQI